MSQHLNVTTLRRAALEIPLLVKEFHEVFGHPVGETAQVYPYMSELRAIQRIDYTNEECFEGVKACLAGDKIEALDAVGDVIYFLAGNLVELGMATSTEYVEAVCDRITENDLTVEAGEFVKNTKLSSWDRYLRAMLVAVSSDLTRRITVDLSLDEPEYANRVDMANPSGALLCGCLAVMANVFDADPLDVLKEIHRANLTRLLPETLEDEEDCYYYMENNGCEVDLALLDFKRTVGGKWAATRRDTGKVVKNPVNEKPNMAQFITEETVEA